LRPLTIQELSRLHRQNPTYPHYYFKLWTSPNLSEVQIRLRKDQPTGVLFVVHLLTLSIIENTSPTKTFLLENLISEDRF